eukprot:symbB.v1.2.025925.t1/scaffold2551.1/size76478/11
MPKTSQNLRTLMNKASLYQRKEKLCASLFATRSRWIAQFLPARLQLTKEGNVSLLHVTVQIHQMHPGQVEALKSTEFMKNAAANRHVQLISGLSATVAQSSAVFLFDLQIEFSMVEDLEAQPLEEVETRHRPYKVFFLMGALFLVAAALSAVCSGRSEVQSVANLRGTVNKGDEATLQMLFPSGYQTHTVKAEEDISKWFTTTTTSTTTTTTTTTTTSTTTSTTPTFNFNTTTSTLEGIDDASSANSTAPEGEKSATKVSSTTPADTTVEDPRTTIWVAPTMPPGTKGAQLTVMRLEGNAAVVSNVRASYFFRGLADVFPVSAMGAGAGSIALGTAGAAAGACGGGVMGGLVGLVPAAFTFGLSIPIGIAVGGTTGLLAGGAVGSGVGFAGGGGLACLAYRQRGLPGTLFHFASSRLGFTGDEE